MPTKLPVPSKGALRALRHLALGTTCTLAFSAGMLTEDRRRGIHAAREVHNNAQRLKSSKYYSSMGGTAIEVLEDDILRYDDGQGFWLSGDPAMRKLTRDTNRTLSSGGTNVATVPEAVPFPPPFSISKPELPLFPPNTVTWRAIPTIPSNFPVTPPLPPLLPVSKAKVHNRQNRLATDVSKLLGDGQDPINVKAASLRFLDTFEEGLTIDAKGLIPQLIDSALKLSKACQAQLEFEFTERILDIVLRYPPIDELQFQSLAPYEIIRRMLDNLSVKRYSQSNKSILEKASSIYMTKFEEKPQIMTSSAQSLGKLLCAETCREGLFELTEKLYFYIQSCRNGGQPQSVDYLIKAAHGLNHHKKVFRYFTRFYTQTSPDQLQFYNTVGLVIDSCLATGKTDHAEEVLFTASQMAEANGILTSTTDMLKVLGQHWRSTQDILKTRDLFDRLEPIIKHSSHPQAAYSAIIQFCVEANQENTALSYFERFQNAYEELSNDLRIYGHFALAKAMRGDWVGVREYLQNMAGLAQLNPNGQDDYSRVFVPILKLHAKSHTTEETEGFVHDFVDNHQLKLTQFIFNIMIDVYAKGKEIDSLGRWMEYATASGCKIDAISFNTLLHHCYKTWGFSFDDAYQLYSEISEKLGSKFKSFTDNDTIEILGRIAVAKSTTPDILSKNLQLLKKLGRPKQTWDSQGVYRAMSTTFAKGDLEAALKIYKIARAEKMKLNSKHLLTAVRASLELGRQDVKEAVSLIREFQREQQDVDLSVAHLAIHQMTLASESGVQARSNPSDTALSIVSSIEAQGFKISLSVLTHTMHLLTRRRQFRQAIEFWNTVSHRYDIQPSSLDMVALTVFMRVFAGLEDENGVRWTVNVLESNGISPDTGFYVELKRIRDAKQKVIDSEGGSSHSHRFLTSLSMVIRKVAALRRTALGEQQKARYMTINIMNNAIRNQERDQKEIASAFRSNKPQNFERNGIEKEEGRLETDDVLESDSEPIEADYDIDDARKEHAAGW